VHRIGTGKRSPVYANVTELKLWLDTSEAPRQEYANEPSATPGPALVVQRDGKPMEESRRLLAEATALARKIAETSVRQRRQAEDLQARILQMRAHVR
jgi:hypothetical protein